MNAHAYKKIPPKQPEPVSFVKAVTQWGDVWRIAFPVDQMTLHSSATLTHDSIEASLMRFMETGVMARVDTVAIFADDYPAIIVNEYAFGFSAVREGYDGAPDSRCPIGVGLTRFQAIADLLDAEELRR